MSSYIIQGGKPLKGTITVNTAKNSAVALLCAATMVQGVVVLRDMPRIQEVERILELLASIGVKFSWKDKKTLQLNCSGKLHMETIDKRACRNTRASLLLLGALSARVKEFKLYKSGGCKLGKRTVKPHLFALEKFGVEVASKPGYYEVKNKRQRAGTVIMYEAGDTPTENAIMAAVLTPGRTTIKFASANYMVQDLCHFLISAGAKISGIGTTTLQIDGVKKLKKTEYNIMPDPIEAFAFVALGVTTNSEITIKNCPLDFLELELEKIKIMGQKFHLSKERKSKNGNFRIADITLKKSQLVALPDKISCQPFPGLNIDNLPFFIPILTQAKGRTLVHDWVYENRAIYGLELQKLGAEIYLIDPHRLFVEGKSKMMGAELMCPPAIRPAVAVLIAMIAAKGKSLLRNCYPIERGYENIVSRLHDIGVDIEQVN